MPLTTKTAMDAIRKPLYDSIDHSDVHWCPVNLTVVTTAGTFHDYGTIQVSQPLMKKDATYGNLFIPATKPEMWALAKRLGKDAGWFPLTRAVADQAHNGAHYEKPVKLWGHDLYNFVAFSDHLKSTTKYETYNPTTKLVSGHHKYWVLSAWPNQKSCPGTTNYGCYVDPKNRLASKGGPGAYIDKSKYNVIQALGGEHDTDWWDYSQLIQFMKDFKADGAPDLRKALVVGNPAIWDEMDPGDSKITFPESFLPF